jgi:BirA family biotin operon repressor/biotin-[acetyl-CoA-carboxylase] ligase
MSTLDRAAVARATSGCRLCGRPDAIIEVHEELASTNDRAAALGREGAPEGSLVVALRQTAGRGRHGRVWSSPAGGLYVSIVLRPDDAMLRRLPATLLAGLAVAEAIDATATTGPKTKFVRADLKWPNDVHMGGRKVSGILGELTRDATGALLVLGLGVNVSTDPAALPAELREVATSVAAARGEAPDVVALLGAILERFEEHYDAVRRGGGATILSAASARMPVLGKGVRVRLVDRLLEGRAAGLNATGGLIVETAAGQRETVVAGEVEEVRPT